MTSILGYCQQLYLVYEVDDTAIVYLLMLQWTFRICFFFGRVAEGLVEKTILGKKPDYWKKTEDQ